MMDEERNIMPDENPAAEETKKTESVPLIIGIVATAVILLALVVFGAVKGGLLMEKHDKLLLMTYNTIKDDTIGGTLIEAGQVLNGDELTTDLDCTVDAGYVNVDVKGQLAFDKKNYKSGGSLEVGTAGITEEVQYYLDDGMIQAAVPELSDYTFEYRYDKAGKGYLADLIEDETDGSIEDVNTLLSAAADLCKKSGKYEKAAAVNLRKAFKKIKIKKAEKEEVEINDKTHRVSGYEFELTGDDMCAFVDALQKAQETAYKDSYEDISDALDNLGADDFDPEDYYDDMKDSLEDMDDITVCVYPYKNKLALVTLKSDGDKLSVEFLGGDTRTSEVKITFKSNGNKQVIKKKSSVSDKKEKGKITVEGNEVLSYSYDTAEGKYKLSSGGMSVKGDFQVKKGKSVELSADAGVIDLDMTMTKGARISKLKGDDVFDLANADEDDYEDLLDDLKDNFSGVSDALDDLF